MSAEQVHKLFDELEAWLDRRPHGGVDAIADMDNMTWHQEVSYRKRWAEYKVDKTKHMGEAVGLADRTKTIGVEINRKQPEFARKMIDFSGLIRNGKRFDARDDHPCVTKLLCILKPELEYIEATAQDQSDTDRQEHPMSKEAKATLNILEEHGPIREQAIEAKLKRIENKEGLVVGKPGCVRKTYIPELRNHGYDVRNKNGYYLHTSRNVVTCQ